MILTQTIALFVDAYRELNARRLFWITLAISILIAAVFGAVGINQQGIEVFWKTFPNEHFNSVLISKAELYAFVFEQFGINWWLTFIATILALVSTAGIFPEFLASGAIDLYLSKPISRLRLFLTKYLTGLMFVALQVTAFCIAAFFVIGFRGGVWKPAIFVSVPFVLLFFSYLFSVAVLFGVLTRSTIATLMLTILIWIATAGLHIGEVFLLRLSITEQLQAQDTDGQIQHEQSHIDQLTAAGAHVPSPDSTQPVTFNDRDLQMSQLSLQQLQQQRTSESDPFVNWHRLAFAITYPLPKTSETVDLIRREIGERMHFRPEPPPDSEEDQPEGRNIFRNRNLMRRAGRETERQLALRSTAYILGTSLTFEAVMLLLAAWLFCRRDF